MDLFLFLKGVFAGFVIAAPVGPVGILCAQRTLNTGIAAGLIAGSGAAIADTIFGAVAAFGLTFIADFLIAHESIMRIFGGVLLLGLGVHSTFFKKLKEAQAAQEAPNFNAFAGDVASTFVLTITNPITILAFSPVFLAVGAVVAESDIRGAWTLILGVFAGSTLWWCILCVVTGLFRRKVTHGVLSWINRVSGVLIFLFGVVILLSITGWGARLIGQSPIKF